MAMMYLLSECSPDSIIAEDRLLHELALLPSKNRVVQHNPLNLGNRIVQEEKIRLVTGVPLHLADERLLLLPIHRAEDLRIELPQFRLLDAPIHVTAKSDWVIRFKNRKI